MQDLPEVLQEAKNGDKDAFGKIYIYFRKRIFRYTLYLLYDRAVAEDITQLTFLKCWLSLPSYTQGRGTLQAYLFAIARNLCIDYQRRKKEVSLESIAEPEFNDDPEDKLIKKDNVKMVKNLLTGLPGEERQLIILRFFEELHFGEIARVLNKKESAVRVKVHRILKKLKEKIGGKYEF